MGVGHRAGSFFAHQTFALLAPIEISSASGLCRRIVVSCHAAMSMIAYGAFAPPAWSGVMYLCRNGN